MPDVAFQSIGEGIWDYGHDIRFWGLWLPHRMTVIRLSGGNLLLHSPTRCDESIVGALRELGTVTDLVAPSRFHDLFLEEWMSAVPEARLWIPPGMGRRFPCVPGRVHEISQDVPWAEVACVPLEGLPMLNETAFYHHGSTALIVADLLFNIQVNARPATRAVARLGGFYRKLAMPRDLRWCVRDREALKQSVRRILNFPIERIIIGHGANIIGDGRTEFRRALQWLLDDDH